MGANQMEMVSLMTWCPRITHSKIDGVWYFSDIDTNSEYGNYIRESGYDYLLVVVYVTGTFGSRTKADIRVSAHTTDYKYTWLSDIITDSSDVLRTVRIPGTYTEE